jgi:hypothetical protein
MVREPRAFELVFDGIANRTHARRAISADHPEPPRTEMNSFLFRPLLALLAGFSPARPDCACADNAVLHWNRVVTDALAAANTDPISESRDLAIVQISVHDALNAIRARSDTYLPPSAPGAGASPEAAIASASHDTLVAILPGAKTALDQELAHTLASITDADARTRGVELGRRVAAAILAARAKDGADRQVAFPPGTKPGEYRPTPPDETPAFMAQWGNVTPFALKSSSQFRPTAPPAPDSDLALRDVAQVSTIGGKESSARNDEQSEIARFWYENSGQGWNRIARTVAQSHGLDDWDSARLLALLNVAMADGFISGFEAKYHYAFWRPATAIRAAGEKEWLSYLPTPPVPDHPSTHTVLGAAAATVLARFFESDFVAFETTSGAPYPGLSRKFWSFSEAARENGASRILAGIHFPTAVRAGYQLGEDVGTWTFEHTLRPRAAAALQARDSRSALR